MTVPGIVWPPLVAGADPGAALIALVRTLEESQWLPPDEIARRQRVQLAAVVAHHARFSPAFAARLATAGLTPGDLADGNVAGGNVADDLAALPPVGRRAFQQADGCVAASVPASHGALRTASTSGSTGEPLTVRRTQVNMLDWQAMVMRHHLWHAVPQPARFAALRAGLRDVRALPDWGWPSTLFFPSGPMLAIPNERSLDEQAARLEAFAPDVLLAYPSNVEGLIRGGARIRPRQVRTIGETLHPDAAALIAAAWGSAVIDCYSSEEVGYLALRCPDGALYHLMAEMLIVEILDADGNPCARGEEGQVVVTDLRNFATPLIRYAIGDRAVAGRRCGCGRGLPTLARIAGRERNLILMPDGTRNWPRTGRGGYRAIAPVIQFQMIQSARDLIDVRLVVERDLTGTEEAALTAHMQRALGAPFALDFHYFEGELPRGPTGKFEEFACVV